MPIRSPKAKKLTTTSEFALYAQSLRRYVRDFTPAALRKKVSGARRGTSVGTGRQRLSMRLLSKIQKGSRSSNSPYHRSS